MQFSCLPQGRGDVIHRFIKGQVRICKQRVEEAGEGQAAGEHLQATPGTPVCPRPTERLNRSSLVETDRA